MTNGTSPLRISLTLPMFLTSAPLQLVDHYFSTKLRATSSGIYELSILPFLIVGPSAQCLTPFIFYLSLQRFRIDPSPPFPSLLPTSPPPLAFDSLPISIHSITFQSSLIRSKSNQNRSQSSICSVNSHETYRFD